MAMANTSNTSAPTQFIQTNLEKYAYRRLGKGNGLPLSCRQHFPGTLDNWDPAVIAQEDHGRCEYAWAGETGETLFRSKRVESGGRRSLRSSARPEKARWRASGRPRCRNRSDHGLSSLGKVQWRAFRQARQDHAVVPGRQRRLRQYDSSPQFLHAERASPKRHAVDLPRCRAWIVVPVSQVIRSASFAVSRFRRHQLCHRGRAVRRWRIRTGIARLRIRTKGRMEWHFTKLEY